MHDAPNSSSSANLQRESSNSSFRVAKELGVFKLLRRSHRHQLLVLTVHGVVPPRAELTWSPLREQIEVSCFARQIDLLAKHHEFVDLAQAEKILDGQALVDNPILLTFDDGYRNNLDMALPILERRGIRPLLFLTTGYLNNTRPFWFDRFDFAIQQIDSTWSTQVGDRRFVFDANHRHEFANVYQELRGCSKGHGWDDVEFHRAFSAWSDQLESMTGKSLGEIQADDPWSATLSTEEIRAAVARNAIDVGSHTVDHFRIDKLNPSERMRQLLDSKQELEALIGKPCVSFCYPNGDWDLDSAADVRAAGFTSAFTTDGGFNDGDSNRFTLLRQFMPARCDEAYLEALGSGALLLKEKFNKWVHRSP